MPFVENPRIIVVRIRGAKLGKTRYVPIEGCECLSPVHAEPLRGGSESEVHSYLVKFEDRAPVRMAARAFRQFWKEDVDEEEVRVVRSGDREGDT